MICLNEIYKFLSRHFSTGCIFYVLILNIEKIPFFSPKYVHREKYHLVIMTKNNVVGKKVTVTKET